MFSVGFLFFSHALPEIQIGALKKGDQPQLSLPTLGPHHDEDDAVDGHGRAGDELVALEAEPGCDCRAVQDGRARRAVA